MASPRDLRRASPAPLAGVRVGVDLDGVCCDYVAYLRTYLIGRGRVPDSLPPPGDYQLSGWFDTAADRTQAHTAAVAAGLHRYAPPIDGAQAGVNALRTFGADVIAVSARGSHGERPDQLRADIDAWSARHAVQFDGVHLGRPKSAANCHLYIDDSPDDIAQLRATGHLAVVFDQPWNRAVAAPRAQDWTQLPQQVIALMRPSQKPEP